MTSITISRVARLSSVLALALAGAASLAACGDDGNTNAGVDASTGTPASLTLAFTRLEPLGASAVYEGWVIVDGAPASTGRFSVDAQGQTSPASFSVPRTTADAATLFVVTIEPAVGDDPAPSETHVLAGALTGGTATLSIAHPAALGTDFATAAGSFILATPTTAANTADNGQGIWFLALPEPPQPSLTLPTLPAGWVYEGWIANAAGPVSTGRFTAAGGADSDAAGATAGPDGAPPFPGQDFINPAIVLTDGATMAVISVEPEPDDSPAPFALKPLIKMPIGTATAPASQLMTNMAAMATISGTVTLR